MSPIQSMFKKQTNSALFVWKIPFDFRSFNCLFFKLKGRNNKVNHTSTEPIHESLDSYA